jgi:hypothetical protein
MPENEIRVQEHTRKKPDSRAKHPAEQSGVDRIGGAPLKPVRVFSKHDKGEVSKGPEVRIVDAVTMRTTIQGKDDPTMEKK